MIGGDFARNRGAAPTQDWGIVLSQADGKTVTVTKGIVTAIKLGP